ncbi:hypothetical protein BB559_001290 [Furculomyces boomerangus]|uniref:Uncharacterized protein n=2 Tax=Harpellales TaxID=61421 RepID=A0A2T9Z2I3_9FUNG|nr:hypothetical protein BB559_001290 [Furculomyces boomerangus]PVZ96640.1 hypothetical protein BB558_007441 [Smittium angustum]PWA01787.1 hypothetical protein BB558_002077 [Smittium angustum]
MKSITLLLACSLSSVFAIEFFQVYPQKNCHGNAQTFIPYHGGCENLDTFKSGRFSNSGKIKIFTEKDCRGHSYEIDLSKTRDHSCINTDIDQLYKSVFYTE